MNVKRDDLTLGRLIDHFVLHECDKCGCTECGTWRELENVGWTVREAARGDTRVITLCKTCTPPKRTDWFNFKPVAP